MSNQTAVFMTNEELADSVSRVLGMLAPHKRGDVVGHECFEEVAGISREATPSLYFRMVQKVLRGLQSARGITLLNVHDKGYKLMTSGETIGDYARMQHRRMNRARTRYVRAAESLPAKDMTLHQMDVRNKTVEAFKFERRKAKRDIKLLQALTSKPDSLPKASVRARTTVELSPQSAAE